MHILFPYQWSAVISCSDRESDVVVFFQPADNLPQFSVQVMKGDIGGKNELL